METVEIWTYVGRRLDRRNKFYYLWLSPNDEDFLVYSRLRGASPGVRYEVRVTRTEGTAMVMTDIRFIGHSDDPRVPEWEAIDRSEWTAKEAIQAEAKYKRENDSRFGDLTLQEVARLYWSRSGARRGAFLTQVISFMLRGGDRD